MADTPIPPTKGMSGTHNLEWDPPAGMSAAKRWTCWRVGCGHAVIDYCGNVYGSATEQACEGEGS